MSEDHIVLDVEIQKCIEELPGGWSDTHLMGVAVAVVYEFRSDRFRIYGHDDIDRLRQRLLAADRISGFNIWRFDYPVIFGLPSRSRVEELRGKTNDILLRIWRSLGLDTESFGPQHKGWSLSNVVGGTFGTDKIANGADAPLWFQAGQIARVANYCADDVALERDLTAFVDRHGFVVNGATGRVLRIKPEWQP